MRIDKIKVGELHTNCYLIENNNEALIVDPGDEYDKIKQLYDIASNTTNIYDQIFFLTSKGILSDNSNEYDNLIENAKLLVLKESSILSNLGIEELDVILNDLRIFIKNNFELTSDDDLESIEGIEVFLKSISSKYDYKELSVDPDVLLRLFDRLKNQTYILCGDAIKMKLKKDNESLLSYEVSVWDSVMSILNIRTIKNIKDKIYSLIPSSDDDIKFIKDLKYELECSKLTYFYATFASEIFAIFTNNDIDKIAMPSIDKLKELDVLDVDLFNEFLLAEARIILNDLSNIDYLEYTPECIFYFLRLVTAFEVLINNMDINTLIKIEEDCNKLTNNKNLACMDGINNFVKKKIKRNK